MEVYRQLCCQTFLKKQNISVGQTGLSFNTYCPHMNTTSTGITTTTRMNILHIAGKLDPRLGGVAQAIRTIVGGLQDLGFYNEVITLDNPQAPFLKEEAFVIHTPGEGRSAWYYSPQL